MIPFRGYAPMQLEEGALMQSRPLTGANWWFAPRCVPDLSPKFDDCISFNPDHSPAVSLTSFVDDVTKVHCCSSTGPKLLKAMFSGGKETKEKT